MMIIFLVILVVIGFFIYKSIGKKDEINKYQDHETILNERFARGEIDLDTYKQMKDELNK